MFCALPDRACRCRRPSVGPDAPTAYRCRCRPWPVTCESRTVDWLPKTDVRCVARTAECPSCLCRCGRAGRWLRERHLPESLFSNPCDSVQSHHTESHHASTALERRWVLLRERRWVLLKIPRCDIDGVGEGKWREGREGSMMMMFITIFAGD